METLTIPEAKNKCLTISSQIQSLPLTNITNSCKQTLLRLVNSELKFLTRLTTTPTPSPSFNIGYIECILHIALQPSISKISRICKPSNGVHVDIVCTLHKTPVWVLVSDRNPKYVTWLGRRNKCKGVKQRVGEVLEAAREGLRLKPVSVLLFFGNGVDGCVEKKLIDEFGASEFKGFEDLDSGGGRFWGKAQTFRIMVDSVESLGCNELGKRISSTTVLNSEGVRNELCGERNRGLLGEKFCDLVLSMRLDVRCDVVKGEDLLGEDVLNFDTTALIAIVSGISNGGTEKLLATAESELRARFKGNYEFVIAQVTSELQKPIMEELTSVVSGKIGMICESVHLEFKELVSMCGGPNEKLRADQLLKSLLIVPDNPSARMMDIITTRKIASKNKVVFGTGDQWLAPTLTANMGFVRAISQTECFMKMWIHLKQQEAGVANNSDLKKIMHIMT